ncbi:MAG: glutamate--cysteine ligase, partial [Thiobacillus sp.]|nr:glutamate--cysteine ligase [Thiobacillus sp.]
VPVFEQAVELGGYAGLAEPAIRRVTFGRDYVSDSLLELFQEDLKQYPALLPVQLEEAPERFPHLRLHNGAIWRWVRPLIGFDEAGHAHVRLEQRVLPSGPSVLDMVATAAFYYGLVHGLARRGEAAVRDLDFADTRSNFYAAARHGLEAELVWLDGRRQPARDSSWRPACRWRAGFAGVWPVRRRNRTLSRCGGNPHAVQPDRGAMAVATREATQGDGHRMMNDYLEDQRSGAPVHEWRIGC